MKSSLVMMISTLKNIAFKLLYLAVLVYLLVYTPIIFKYKPLVILSGSMEPILKVGGILYYKEIPKNQFKTNDILVYKTSSYIVSNRVLKSYPNFFITKGDNNSHTETIYIESIIGKGTNWSIPLIGYYVTFIYNHKIILYLSLSLIFIDYIYEKRKVNS